MNSMTVQMIHMINGQGAGRGADLGASQGAGQGDGVIDKPQDIGKICGLFQQQQDACVKKYSNNYCNMYKTAFDLCKEECSDSIYPCDKYKKILENILRTM